VEYLVHWPWVCTTHYTLARTLSWANDLLTRYKKYHATPPGKSLQFTPIGNSQKAASHRQFQSVVRNAGLLPPSVKEQVVQTIGSPTNEDTWRGATFRAFCYITGWGVEQDLELGKGLIDQASGYSPNSAIFQTMFLSTADPSRQSAEELEYATQVFTFLRIAQMHGSHEATHKLMQYFPVPCGYPLLRSRAYRGWKYRISTKLREPQHPGEDIRAIQEDDIKLQFSLQGPMFAQIRHSKLHFAVAMGYVEAIITMLDSPTFDRSLLVLQDYHGDTPLLLALRFGWCPIVQRLIDAGSDVQARNFYGETVFHFLVELNDPAEKVKLAELFFALCEPKLAASVCTESSFPKEQIWLLGGLDGPPLKRIVFRNDVALAKVFLQRNVSPASSEAEFDALDLAAALHSYEMLEMFWEYFPGVPAWATGELLAKACCSFSPQRMYLHGTKTSENVAKALDCLMDKMEMLSGKPLVVGDAPLLHFALNRSVDQEILQHIISKSTADEINAYTVAGDLSVTAIHIAIQAGFSGIVESLLRKGGDVLRPVRHVRLGCSYSTLTALCGHWSSTNKILRQIIDVHATQSVPIPASALTNAMLSNNFSAAAMLLRAGADINGVEDSGLTPLGRAIKQCTVDTVAHLRFLLEYPSSVGRVAADFVVQPVLGITALHVLAVIPSCTPYYDRRTLINVTDYLLHKFGTSAEINARPKDTGCTALHLASKSNPIVVRKLLEQDEIDMTLKTRRDGKTAREYNAEYLVQSVPEVVARCGERTIKRYRRDQIEVRNLFAEKCGEKQTNWHSATKMGEVPVGGGKVMNIMFVSMDKE
jgi:ankyrin repeat protein